MTPKRMLFDEMVRRCLLASARERRQLMAEHRRLIGRATGRRPVRAVPTAGWLYATVALGRVTYR